MHRVQGHLHAKGDAQRPHEEARIHRRHHPSRKSRPNSRKSRPNSGKTGSNSGKSRSTSGKGLDHSSRRGPLPVRVLRPRVQAEVGAQQPLRSLQRRGRRGSGQDERARPNSGKPESPPGKFKITGSADTGKLRPAQDSHSPHCLTTRRTMIRVRPFN